MPWLLAALCVAGALTVSWFTYHIGYDKGWFDANITWREIVNDLSTPAVPEESTPEPVGVGGDAA